jgi:hypothetical protein
MSTQHVNREVMLWALEEARCANASEQLVLAILVFHANSDGYTWPSLSLISSQSKLDIRTVRRCIASLLANHAIFRTKNRYGKTGQVQEYRLPRCTRRRGAKMHSLENPKEDIKTGESRTQSRTQSSALLPREHRTWNKEHGTYHGDARLNGNGPHELSAAKQHWAWPEFLAYCRRINGKPGNATVQGFNTWLNNRPSWWWEKHSSKATGKVVENTKATPNANSTQETEQPTSDEQRKVIVGQGKPMFEGLRNQFAVKINANPLRSELA